MNIKYFIDNPKHILIGLMNRLGPLVPDKIYVKVAYALKTGKKLNLKNPQTFNEKLQWLKLYDRNPLYTRMVDKYAVKEYVANIIGKEYIIPLIGVWERFDDIDFSVFPDKFVIKTTHDSGGIVICKDKGEFDISDAKKKINKHLEKNLFYSTREWPYKNVIPRIIAEEYLVDESGVQLKDYKVFAFNGMPKVIEVDYDRFVNHKTNMYTTEWEFIDLELTYPNDPNYAIKKPVRLEEMLYITSILSKNIPHVRVDFYVIGEKIYFGELTFCSSSGMEKFIPEEWNYKFGAWIKLPEQNNKVF